MLTSKFQPLETPTIEGIEFVEFLISPNKGEPLKSLNKIASEENFRIMLALKVYSLNQEVKLLFCLMKLTRVFRSSSSKMAEK